MIAGPLRSPAGVISQKVEDRINWVYSSANEQELAERYNTWAKDYDNDLEDRGGYIAPQRVVETLAKYLPKDAKILDAGVGTGLIGLAGARRKLKK